MMGDLGFWARKQVYIFRQIVMKIILITIIIIVLFFYLALAGRRIYENNFIYMGESEQVVINTLKKNARFIESCSRMLDINPRLLASVIYAERRVNVNIVDSFEELYVFLGGDPSIGLTQIKKSTSFWIINTAKDTKSSYSLPQKYLKYLPVYDAHDELIKILMNDSTNSLLAAIHIKQIIKRWQIENIDISNRPDIIMTLYSYGLFSRRTGKELMPNANMSPNKLGRIAKSFFLSSKLKGEYP